MAQRGAFEVLPGLTPSKLLDSSAIIDGRILDIAQTGFVEGELLVPRFVLEELQHLADSGDAEKRVRGRRGLDFVRRLQSGSGAVRIDSGDYPGVDAIDAKLVRSRVKAEVTSVLQSPSGKMIFTRVLE